MGLKQSMSTKGKRLLRNEKFLLNLQLLHSDLVSMLSISRSVRRKIDLRIRRSPVFLTGNSFFRVEMEVFSYCQSCRLVFGSCQGLTEWLKLEGISGCHLI